MKFFRSSGRYPQGMASRAEALPRQKTAARKKSGKASITPIPMWAVWTLVLLGMAAAYYAVRYAEVLPLLGPAGLVRLRLIAPLAMLAHQPQLGIPDATADTVAQVLMYAQFPFYGLLLGLVWRMAGFVRAAVTVLLLHVIAVGAVLLLAQL